MQVEPSWVEQRPFCGSALWIRLADNHKSKDHVCNISNMTKSWSTRMATNRHKAKGLFAEYYAKCMKAVKLNVAKAFCIFALNIMVCSAH